MPCKHSDLHPADAKCLQNIHSLWACSKVPIWPVVTAVGSVTGSLASGQVCLDITVCLVDQGWLMFSLHGYLRRASTTLRTSASLAGLLCKDRAILPNLSLEFIASITKSLPWIVWLVARPLQTTACSGLALLLNVWTFVMESEPALDTYET